jgi:formylglycine-generating enzyme required for sulfatase activity
LAALAVPVWSQKPAAAHRKASPPRMVLIPAGEFWMGSPDGVGSADEHPRHKVSLSAFYLDKFHVSAEEYAVCVKAGNCSVLRTSELCNYGVAARGKDPINCVTWDEAEAYCKSVGKRLPTEAEWEKAARGGTGMKWSFGAGVKSLGGYAWYGANSGGSTHPVGMRNPNQYGLYDMAGNAWQWVADWYDAHYYQKSPAEHPEGPLSGRYRVLRGGSWKNQANSTRVAIRYWVDPELNSDDIGFRCAK